MQKIIDAAKQELNDQYLKGLREGLAAAEKIVTRYRENTKYLEPLSPEKLLQFAEHDLKLFQDKINSLRGTELG